MLSPRGQQGRKDGDGGMAKAAEVVVVQSVTHSAVDQRCVQRRGAFTRGQDGRLRGAAQVAGVAADDVAHLLRRAGEDHAQQVKAGFVGDPYCVRGDVLIGGVHDPFGHHFGCAHIDASLACRVALPIWGGLYHRRHYIAVVPGPAERQAAPGAGVV